MAAVLALAFALPSTIVAVASSSGSSGHTGHHKVPQPPQWPLSYSVRACTMLEALADSCEALHLQPNVKAPRLFPVPSYLGRRRLALRTPASACLFVAQDDHHASAARAAAPRANRRG
jgi:hypothetical protein